MAIAVTASTIPTARGEGDGLLRKDGKCLFPIGFYELPADDAKLKAMADAGVNLVRCGKRADLDRLQALGMQAVVPLSLQQGATDALRKRVESLKDHPAVAVWEGPDEVVWNFTAYSGLFRKHGVYKTRDAWWKQAPEAIEYSESKGREIVPKLREGIRLVRKLDPHKRQVWFNEAHESDLKFVRAYLDDVDITGCDLYPVKHKAPRLHMMGPAVEHWKRVGRGKPVWMVLQAFSWNELGDYYGAKQTAYPTFPESRFMAYDVIAHGGRGILYWGSRFLKSDPFRQSVYALTSELAALQPFLVAPEVPDTRVRVIEPDEGLRLRGACHSVRRSGDDWLIILVNDDKVRHMGVEVTGLNAIEGRELVLLYGIETATIRHGELITRMQPFEVKVFATGRKWETKRRNGRKFNAPQ